MVLGSFPTLSMILSKCQVTLFTRALNYIGSNSPILTLFLRPLMQVMVLFVSGSALPFHNLSAIFFKKE